MEAETYSRSSVEAREETNLLNRRDQLQFSYQPSIDSLEPFPNSTVSHDAREHQSQDCNETIFRLCAKCNSHGKPFSTNSETSFAEFPLMPSERCRVMCEKESVNRFSDSILVFDERIICEKRIAQEINYVSAADLKATRGLGGDFYMFFCLIADFILYITFLNTPVKWKSKKSCLFYRELRLIELETVYEYTTCAKLGRVLFIWEFISIAASLIGFTAYNSVTSVASLIVFILALPTHFYHLANTRFWDSKKSETLTALFSGGSLLFFFIMLVVGMTAAFSVDSDPRPSYQAASGMAIIGLFLLVAALRVAYFYTNSKVVLHLKTENEHFPMEVESRQVAEAVVHAIVTRAVELEHQIRIKKIESSE